MNGHLGPLHAWVREADVGDALGQGLDQVDGVGLDRVLHLRHEASVVDGVLQVVGASRLPGVDPEHQVGPEHLAVPALEAEDPVVSEGLDPEHGEPVGLLAAHPSG